MTDDIVDRLLSRADEVRGIGDDGGVYYDAVAEIKSLRRENERLREAMDRLERCIKFKQPDGRVSKITNWYSAALALQDIREALKGKVYKSLDAALESGYPDRAAAWAKDCKEELHSMPRAVKALPSIKELQRLADKYAEEA